MKKVLVAFSGGVDSTLLLKAALDVLGPDALAVIASSETYPGREVRAARALARRLGAQVLVVHTREIDNPAFSENSPRRCYHCKLELFSLLRKMADERGLPYVLDGSNADDRSDYRPGSQAGRELGIRSPLQEAGLTKADIRALSREFGLPTWNKPSMACLASRFPYHVPIERANLVRVGKAEDALRRLGLAQLRVRHHGDIARIEVPAEEFPKLMEVPTRRRIVARFKKLGYIYVTLDLEGYRTGSLNEPLGKSRPRVT
ncbi:MAG: TIGR00268 family protein [Candidatus Aminicenantes bacterium RBG_16_63_16]|nr:MAG: TIGR00268 family protein [Candidatus Aminicenantes bacterium RBG_16_63_16]